MKKQTNTALVNHIMEYSNHGALAQVFVLDALLKFSEKVAESDPSEMEGSIVDGRAWRGVAIEIRDKIKKHLGE